MRLAIVALTIGGAPLGWIEPTPGSRTGGPLVAHAGPSAPRLEVARPEIPSAPHEHRDETRPAAPADTKGTATTLEVAIEPGDAREVELSFILPSPTTPVTGGPALAAFRAALVDADGAERAVTRIEASTGPARWQTARLPIPTDITGDVRLVATAHSAPGAAPPTIGTPLLRRADTRPTARNVVLVSLDTLRADRLSSYGNEVATSPTMDRLARTGTRFETVIAPASSTAPSHMTMFTGRLPCAHGVWGLHLDEAPPPEMPILAEELARAGYRTAAFTENAYVGRPFGFARGFDSFDENKEYEPDAETAPGISTPTGLGPQTFREALDWLEKHRDERFFLFLHTYHVHAPRRVAPDYADLFPLPPGSPSPPENFQPEFHAIRRYDQLIRHTDDLVRELVATLERLGLEEDTILVITSDHGEAFGDHGVFGHGHHVYGEMLRVPWIVHAPGLARPQRIETPVALLDVAPTVLDLAALPVPGSMEGTSFAAEIRGEAPERAARALYAEAAPGKARAIRDDRFKIIREDEVGERLFDLSVDPLEENPVSPTDPSLGPAEHERIARLRTELDRHAARCRAGRAALAEARRDPPAEDRQRRDKLRALGYLE